MDTGNNIRWLMRPRSVALIGCSEQNLAGIALHNLLLAGYEGKIYPVHPKHKSVHGVECYPSLADVPGEVDACVVALRNTLLPGFIREMHAKGVKGAVLYAAGFGEAGEEGRLLQREVTQMLRETGIAACGPNCLGLISLHEKATLYGADCDIRSIEGKVGIVSHSGAICVAYASAARGAGFSHLISCGCEAGLSMADFIIYMLEDTCTEAVFCFMETIRDAAGLARAGRLSLEKNKPVIVLKTGKSEAARATAAAHSGALAGSAELSDAFLRRHGFLLADSFDEVSEALELLLKWKDKPLPKSDGIALTAISGGQLGFCSDVMQQTGLRFGKITAAAQRRIGSVLPGYATAKNPLDVTTALFDTPAYQECLRALADEDDIGAVLVCQDAEHRMCADEVNLYRGILRALGEAGGALGKPLAVFSPLSGGLHGEFTAILDEHGLPLLQGAHESIRAVKLYFDWVGHRRAFAAKQRAEKATGINPAQEAAFPVSEGVRALSEHESKRFLAAWGIPVTEERLAATEDEAVRAAFSIGMPVAMKIDSPDIPHKTEAGGVRLDLHNEADVRLAWREIMANAKAYRPDARLDGVSVQEMAGRGVEILLGVKNDDLLGPAVLVGLGGIYTEVFRDCALRMAPVARDEALEMIESLKGAKLLHGARGMPEADVDALADALVRLSQLAWQQREYIRELDINPLMVLERGKGVKAVDALVVPGGQGGSDQRSGGNQT